jgi:hypothetical protein
MSWRRARGVILRLIRRRPLAALVGLVLAVPAVWVEFFTQVDAWWVDGAALIAGATGIALLWTAVTGIVPDWIDEGSG